MAPPKIQIKRTSTANSPPVGLLPGELSVEMSAPTRLWVGVPTSVDITGKKLLLDLSVLPPSSVVTGDAPPVTPIANQLWWETDTGILWLWYTDADSSQWVQVNASGGGGGGVIVSETAPAAPAQGDLWYESDAGILWMYYDDGTSTQWVQVNGSGGGGGDFVAKTGDTMSGDLTIAKTATPAITFNNTDTAGGPDSGGGYITAQHNGVDRWKMIFGASPLGTANAGSSYSLYYTDDVGAAEHVMSAYRDGNIVLGKVTANAVITLQGVCNITNVTTINSGSGVISPIESGLKVSYLGGVAQHAISIRPINDTTTAISFCSAAGTMIGSISTTTTATAYNTGSDERLKQDLQPFDAGSIIDATQVYDFQWKATGERAHGVIAQQAVTVYPEAVTHETALDNWGVDYSKYVPVLLQELKALRARVAALEGAP